MNTVYYKDSELMKEITDKSIDMIITSPPYNVNKDYKNYNDNQPIEQYFTKMQRILQECYRTLKNDGRLALNVNYVSKFKGADKRFIFIDYLDILRCVGFNIREIIVWVKSEKNNLFMGNSTAWGSWRSASNPHLRGAVEPILVCNKLTWKKSSGSGINDITADEFKEWTNSIWFIPPEKKKDDHPTSFPIELPYRLIKLYTFVGDTILDPFLGSGTTLLACRMLDRNGIGYEIDESYRKIIENKCSVNIPDIRNYF
jgi:site-specific DNA-methyltransferase (adenine-specific)